MYINHLCLSCNYNIYIVDEVNISLAVPHALALGVSCPCCLHLQWTRPVLLEDKEELLGAEAILIHDYSRCEENTLPGVISIVTLTVTEL